MAVGFVELDEEKERARLRKMSDEQLTREGASSALHVLAIRQFRKAAAGSIRDRATALQGRVASASPETINDVTYVFLRAVHHG